MDTKKYRVGLVLGRFQPLHIGHETLIIKALEQCNKVIVCIGSAQLSKTRTNPLSKMDRYYMIRDCFASEVYDGRLLIFPLNDREKYSNDSSFGEYIMSQLEANGYPLPEAIFEGQEAIRDSWYNSLGVDIIRVDRANICVSGTQMREAIEKGDTEFIHKYKATNTSRYYKKVLEVLTNYE